MRSLTIVLVTTLLLIPSPRYGNAASIQARERAARKACLTGDPDAGLALLADLFIDSEDVTYIFNQGRCLEQNQRYEEAIGRFREFLTKARNLKPEAKADARRRIATCQSYLEKREPEKPVVQEEQKPTPARVEPVAPPKQVEEQPKPSPIVAVRSEPQRSGGMSGEGWRIAGIAVGAVGVAGIAAGLILNLKANGMASDLSKSENYSRSAASSRDSYETYGWMSYGVGVACILGGAVMYYVGATKGERAAPSIGLLPTVSNGMVGTLLVGAF